VVVEARLLIKVLLVQVELVVEVLEVITETVHQEQQILAAVVVVQVLKVVKTQVELAVAV
jgi:hypothetical protein